jgi:hypothetical protein
LILAAEGSSFKLVMRPKFPIPSPGFFPVTALPFQNQSAQWALKPAIPHTILPRYRQLGIPHLMASSMPAPPSWIALRRDLRIGRAKSARF